MQKSKSHSETKKFLLPTKQKVLLTLLFIPTLYFISIFCDPIWGDTHSIYQCGPISSLVVYLRYKPLIFSFLFGLISAYVLAGLVLNLKIVKKHNKYFTILYMVFLLLVLGLGLLIL